LSNGVPRTGGREGEQWRCLPLLWLYRLDEDILGFQIFYLFFDPSEKNPGVAVKLPVGYNGSYC
jgi:hypothetical protein